MNLLNLRLGEETKFHKVHWLIVQLMDPCLGGPRRDIMRASTYNTLFYLFWLSCSVWVLIWSMYHKKIFFCDRKWALNLFKNVKYWKICVGPLLFMYNFLDNHVSLKVFITLFSFRNTIFCLQLCLNKETKQNWSYIPPLQ